MANRRQLYEYKGDQCAHCQLSVREMVERYQTVDRMFEFHHVDPKEKHPEYTKLIRRVISNEQLDEVDKCVLLCRRCHGILHAQAHDGRVQFTVDVEGRSATQTIDGHVIADMKERRAKFLSNERLLVIPYLLQVGTEDPQLYFGRELENDGVLMSNLRNIQEIGTLRVLAYRDSSVLFGAEHIGGDRIRMTMNVAFPVLTSTLIGEGSNSPFIWIRNGVALTKDGKVIQNGTVQINEATLGT